MFLVNSRHPLVCATPTWLPRRGPSSPEVTRAICRVPSTPFSQAPWYALPAHLCRFGVRSVSWGYFLEVLGCLPNPVRADNFRPSSHPSRPRNINLVPIGYAFRPRLRGRLTLRGLALRRNPWAFGESGFSHSLSLLMSAFSLPIPPPVLTDPASQAYGTLRYRVRDQVSGIGDQQKTIALTIRCSNATPAASWRSDGTHHARRPRLPLRM